MRHRIRPRPRTTSTVLLVADSPPRERRRPGTGDSPALRHEALVSFARAVLAAGGQIALPIDVDVAPLIGTVALDYAAAPVAERRNERPPPPLVVMETEGPEPAARGLLAPLAARGALAVVDDDGEPVAPDRAQAAPPERRIDEVRRQPVTEKMVQITRPVFAVFISPGRAALQELAILRSRDTRTVVFRGSVLEPDLAHEFQAEDPTERLLDPLMEYRWARPGQAPTDSHPPRPYAYLMQRLVAELMGERG